MSQPTPHILSLIFLQTQHQEGGQLTITLVRQTLRERDCVKIVVDDMRNCVG